MNNSFYAKLAISNLKKHSKTYIPYILACIFSILTFYIMDALSLNDSLLGIRGGDLIQKVFGFGVVVIEILSLIFLFYTNSFLIKRRKKEIGIYNVLGMEKKHIARVISFETIVVASVSLVLGILGGIIFGKLLFLILLKLMKYGSVIKFGICTKAIINTIKLFCIIFIFILVVNIFQVKMNNPIELLKGGNKGEKEPKASWIVAMLGIIELAVGYYMAITIESPIQSIETFLIATLIVIVGTYTTFISGSIIFLKMLKNNKKFYYKKNNFISVSGMLYRMKQNSTGLASICILSTAVLVTLSTTIALYVGQENSLKVKYPLDIQTSYKNATDTDKEYISNLIEEKAKSNNVTIENKVQYTDMNLILKKDNNSFNTAIKDGPIEKNLVVVTVYPVDDYNKIEGKNINLNDDEVMMFSVANDYNYDNIIINNRDFKISEKIQNLKTVSKNFNDMFEEYIVVVKDINVLQKLQEEYSIDTKMDIESRIDFDIQGNSDDAIRFCSEIKNEASNMEGFLVADIYTDREEFYSINGGAVFLGCFLGILFTMGTILIIYYKQISEGYDDSERFKIMQKVGLSKEEIKKTINKQVLMVFFIPPIVAIIHIIFASKIMLKILALIGMFSTSVMIITICCTILVFLILYVIVYKLTANTYYKIVQ